MIEKDYTYYLYKMDPHFPFNCHTSANLISSYLSTHFNEKFVHRTQKNKWVFHGWTKGENLCVDFVAIQFSINCSDKVKLMHPSKSLSENEVFDIIQKYKKNDPIIVYEDMDSRYDNNGFDHLDIEPLYGLDYARKISNPYTTEGFMEYVNIAIEEVRKNVENCYSCS